MQYEISGRGRKKKTVIRECDRGRRKRGRVRAARVVHRKLKHGSEDSNVQEECRVRDAIGRAAVPRRRRNP